MNDLLIVLAIIALWVLFEEFAQRPLLLMLVARAFILFGRAKRLLVPSRIAWFHVNAPRFLPFDCIALGDCVFVRRSVSEQAIVANMGLQRHEDTHIKQQHRMGSLWFLLRYVGEWLYYCARFGNWKKAYFYISLEKEAYINQHGYKWRPPL